MHFFRLLITLFLYLAISSDFGYAAPQKRLIGGAVVRTSSPVINLLMRGNGIIGGCSGVLIAPKIILTAAHCFRERPRPSAITARIGKQTFPARTWKAHPKFFVAQNAEYGEYDLGLVFLKKAIKQKFSISITPTQLQPGQSLELYGFGSSAIDHPKLKKGLSSVEHATTPWIFTNSFQKQNNEVTACFGDSGGAVFEPYNGTSYHLLGVLTAGILKNDRCGLGEVTVAEDLNAPDTKAFISAYVPTLYQ